MAPWRRGARLPEAHYSRMFWLALFGLAHFYLIWFGDILFLYAVVRLLLFLFRNLSVKALLLWSLPFFLIGIGLPVSLWAMLSMAQAGALPAEAAAGMQEALRQINAEMGPATPNLCSGNRALSWQLRRASSATAPAKWWAIPLFFLGMFMWETMGLMLISMALFKSRMLTGEWELARYRKWAVDLLPDRDPAAGCAGADTRCGRAMTRCRYFAPTMALSIPFDIADDGRLDGADHAADQVGRPATPRAHVWPQPAGWRSPTTSSTSIAMTTIFYGYGLGLFGSVGRTALYLFCFGMWAAMLLWSKPWLERFQYGPLEWLWRSLSRWQLQPMRKTAPAQ